LEGGGRWGGGRRERERTRGGGGKSGAEELVGRHAIKSANANSEDKVAMKEGQSTVEKPRGGQKRKKKKKKKTKKNSAERVHGGERKIL